MSKRKEEVSGRSIKDKTPVLGMAKREGNVIATKLENTRSASIQPVLTDNVEEGSTVYTDEWPGYRGLRFRYEHQIIRHKDRIYVDGDIHTNTIEGFWSQLKRGIIGIYHFVSVKHIDRYLTEFTLRYNTRKITESERFNLILANVAGRLKYKELIA